MGSYIYIPCSKNAKSVFNYSPCPAQTVVKDGLVICIRVHSKVVIQYNNFQWNHDSNLADIALGMAAEDSCAGEMLHLQL